MRESDAVNALQRIAAIAGDPAAPLVLTPAEPALDVFDSPPGAAARRAAGPRRRRGGVARQGPRHRRAAGRGARLLRWAVAPPPARAARPGRSAATRCIAAGRLWDYFRRHARAVLARGLRRGRARLGRQVLAWLRAQRLAQVSRDDVRRQALGQALERRAGAPVIEQLSTPAACARSRRRRDRRRPPAVRWDVNPALIGGSLAETAETPQPRPPPPAASG